MSLNKKLHKIVANYILGDCEPITISGNNRRVNSLKEAMLASRKFFLCLESDSSSLEEILLLASKKNDAAKKFKDDFGFDWHF